MHIHQGISTFQALLWAAAVVLWFAASSASAALWHGGTSKETERWVTAHRRHIEVAGLEPLSEVELPPGQEEIRIFHRGSKYSEGQLLRLVQQDGHIDGEAILFWRIFQGDPDHVFSQRTQLGLAESCMDFRETNSIGSCRGDFLRPPDWRLLYRQLLLDQLWDLPDQAVACERETILFSTGGRTMVVELRRGDRYRAYSYRDPYGSPGCDLDPQAWTIVGRFQNLLSQLQPTMQSLRLQGVIDHLDSTEFWPCDSDRPLIIEPSLAELGLSEIPAAGDDRLELELTALEASEAMVLERGLKADQGLLLLPQVQWIRPAVGPGRACDRGE